MNAVYGLKEENPIIEDHSDSQKPVEKVKVVNCGRLNIRKSPSTRAPVIKVVPAGEIMECNSKYNNPNFYEVRMDGNGKGYAAKAFLKKVSD